ncbi:Putative MFS transporter superfamily [Septoria linicola]|uniref:MFS transporter superfamily n=1 Tax=Septoria linicola TaxID=215465 RepID=A0A9Q9AZM8_9PEZI|nr:Putative MFS transporter superfamily [Septoria linicola]
MAHTPEVEDQKVEQLPRTTVPQTTLPFRKKLPWLDTARVGPVDAERLIQPQTSGQTRGQPDSTTFQYIPSALLSDDPRYRPTGSTPEIREATGPPNVRSHSQSSQQPLGLRSSPIVGKAAATSEVLPSYASSEYSSPSTLSDHDSLPKGFPKKDPASYERLIRPIESPVPGLTQRSTHRDENNAAASSREPVSRGTTRPKPNPNPYRPTISHTATPAPAGRRTARETTPEVRRRSTVRKELPAKRVHLAFLQTTSKTVLPQDLHEFTSSSSQSPRGSVPVAKVATRIRQGRKPVKDLSGPSTTTLVPADREIATVLPLNLASVQSSFYKLPGTTKHAVAHHHNAGDAVVRLHNTQHVVAAKYSAIKDDAGLSATSSTEQSMSRTPPRLYHPRSADSVVRDFAYSRTAKQRRCSAGSFERTKYGGAATYYGDHGESVATQPGIRHSVIFAPDTLPVVPVIADPSHHAQPGKHGRVQRAHAQHNLERVASCMPCRPLRRAKLTPAAGLRSVDTAPSAPRHSHSLPDNVSAEPGHPSQLLQSTDRNPGGQDRKESATSDSDAVDLSLKNPRVNHISVKEGEDNYLRRYHKLQPVAREWNIRRKRLTSFIACLNTIFVGLIAGIYAGEVPRIQYQLEDDTHWVIFGNMLLFIGLGLSTLIFWPLPLLHGRRPYTLIAFGIMLPLQIPQAMIVQSPHGSAMLYKVGLLLPRALTGFALGFANVNFLPTLWDL